MCVLKRNSKYVGAMFVLLLVLCHSSMLSVMQDEHITYIGGCTRK